MPIAITGGAGRLGNALVRLLLERGEAARVLDPEPEAPSLEGLPVERLRGSVLDAEAVEALLEGARAVVHCAAKVDLGADRDGSIRRVNVEGTRIVAEACARRGLRMVHVSSHAALDRRPMSAPLSELNPLALEDPCDYHRSKAEAERMLLERVAQGSLDVVIVSPGTMIGPWDFEPSLFGAAVIQLYLGRIPILLEAQSDYCDVRDVAAATLEAIERGRRGERYLLTGEVLDIREVARIIGRLSGRPAPRYALPLWVGWAMLPLTLAAARLSGKAPVYSAGMLRASVSNPVVLHDKARRELGYAPRDPERSLEEAFDFYRERGWL